MSQASFELCRVRGGRVIMLERIRIHLCSKVDILLLCLNAYLLNDEDTISMVKIKNHLFI